MSSTGTDEVVSHTKSCADVDDDPSNIVVNEAGHRRRRRWRWSCLPPPHHRSSSSVCRYRPRSSAGRPAGCRAGTVAISVVARNSSSSPKVSTRSALLHRRSWQSHRFPTLSGSRWRRKHNRTCRHHLPSRRSGSLRRSHQTHYHLSYSVSIVPIGLSWYSKPRRGS